MQTYEVRPRKDKRGVDLISDALPIGRLWYGEPNAITNAIGYAEHRSRSHRVDLLVAHCVGFAYFIADHQIGIYLSTSSAQPELPDALGVKLVFITERHRLQGDDGFARFSHRLNLLLEPF